MSIVHQSATRQARPRSARRIVGGYLALMKLRVVELLLCTTVPTMLLAAGGFPPLWLVLATLIGGTLAAGSANAINMYVDRDIDAVMKRTRNRPIVTGEVSARAALIFGVLLGVVATVWLGLLVNWLSAWLALGAILFYVVVYTLMLKRRTRQNIVWGGAAGCMPVLIGWSAVTDTVSWAAIVLFGVIFLWTPPHYWPLSMRYREDYSAVHVPMLGAVERPEIVARQIIAYSWAMVACSMLLWPVAPTGLFYPIAAAALGAWFLIEVHLLSRRAKHAETAEQAGAMRVFHVSITYLTLLFVAVGLDPFLRF
ncbi:MAG: heme o synthase [Actinomycetales bacterium]